MSGSGSVVHWWRLSASRATSLPVVDTGRAREVHNGAHEQRDSCGACRLDRIFVVAGGTDFWSPRRSLRLSWPAVEIQGARPWLSWLQARRGGEMPTDRQPHQFPPPHGTQRFRTPGLRIDGRQEGRVHAPTQTLRSSRLVTTETRQVCRGRGNAPRCRPRASHQRRP